MCVVYMCATSYFLTASLWDAYALCLVTFHPSYYVVAYPLFFKFILSFRALMYYQTNAFYLPTVALLRYI
jgi:hypothetical protein